VSSREAPESGRPALTQMFEMMKTKGTVAIVRDAGAWKVGNEHWSN
jgi:hypothetical protein